MRKITVFFLLFTLCAPFRSHGAFHDWSQDKRDRFNERSADIMHLLDKGVSREDVAGMFDKEAEKYSDDTTAMCMLLVNKATVYSNDPRRKTDIEKALKILEDLSEPCRGYFDLHLLKGQLLERKGDIEAAMEAYKKGAEQIEDRDGSFLLQKSAELLFAKAYSFSPDELWELLAANDSLKGKLVTVKGEIAFVEMLPSDKTRTVVAFTLKNRLAFVACYLFTAEAPELRTGQTVAITGYFTGMNEDVGGILLRWCHIRK